MIRVGFLYIEDVVEGGVLIVAAGQVGVPDVSFRQVSLADVHYFHVETYRTVCLKLREEVIRRSRLFKYLDNELTADDIPMVKVVLIYTYFTLGDPRYNI